MTCLSLIFFLYIDRGIPTYSLLLAYYNGQVFDWQGHFFFLGEISLSRAYLTFKTANMLGEGSYLLYLDR